MAELYCFEAEPGGLVGKLGASPVHLAGPLAHVRAWGATASGPPSSEQCCCPLSPPPKLSSLGREPLLLSGWPCLAGWVAHPRGPGTAAVTVAAEVPHWPGAGTGATRGSSLFSGWIRKMEEVSTLENREGYPCFKDFFQSHEDSAS